jgi:hypothetical protein
MNLQTVGLEWHSHGLPTSKKKKPSTQELIAYVFSGLMMVVLGFWSLKSQIFPKLSVALKDVCSRNQRCTKFVATIWK